MILVFRLFVLVALSGAFVACERGNSASEITSVQLWPIAVRVNEIGAEFTFGAIGKSSDGVIQTTLADRFSWLSSDPAVATVDSGGRVTARMAGVAVITSTSNSLRAQSEVRVQNGGGRISGVARYQDKEYGEAGFTGNLPFKPIRFAVVELLDESNRIMLTARSNAEGGYDLGPARPDHFRIRVVASARPAGGTQEARVADNSGAIYAVAKQATWDTVDLSLSVNTEQGPAGAFNILDVLQHGFEMVSARGSVLPDKLSAYWQPDNSYGTYYCQGYSTTDCPQSEGIYVANGPDQFGDIDTDEFDDDVLWHEFGHFVADALSRDDSPGGPHELGKATNDLRLAWSEGWGDYFAVAVKAWLSDNDMLSALSSSTALPLGAYVDTKGVDATSQSGSALYFNLGVPSATSGYLYADSEVAVARILWQLDRQGYADTLFRVFTSTDVLASKYPMNLETIWDAWLDSLPGPNELAVLTETFRERGVDYTPDSGESDQTLVTARGLQPGVDLVRTLYRAGTRGNPAADLDLFWFDVTIGSYFVVETFGLLSGANTQLRLLDGAGVPILIAGAPLGNDDNLGAAEPKAARLSFDAPFTGRIYAEISTSANLSSKDGRYGGYTIRLLAH